ncbi:MAG: N-methylhydantoinase B, partial [uncultured Rubrobacteraceae bacterium]
EGGAARPDPARGPLEPPGLRRRGAGAGAYADLLHERGAGVRRPLRRRLRPARADGRPGRDRHAGPHQHDGHLRPPLPADGSGRDPQARGRAHNQQPAADGRPPQRLHGHHAGLPRRRDRRLFRQHLPRPRRRGPRPRGGRAPGLRGGPLRARDPPVPGGRAQRGAVPTRSGQREDTFRGGRRPPRPGREQRRRRRAARGDDRGVRPRGHRGALGRDLHPLGARHAGCDIRASGRPLRERGVHRRVRRADPARRLNPGRGRRDAPGLRRVRAAERARHQRRPELHRRLHNLRGEVRDQPGGAQQRRQLPARARDRPRREHPQRPAPGARRRQAHHRPLPPRPRPRGAGPGDPGQGAGPGRGQPLEHPDHGPPRGRRALHLRVLLRRRHGGPPGRGRALGDGLPERHPRRAGRGDREHLPRPHAQARAPPRLGGTGPPQGRLRPGDGDRRARPVPLGALRHVRPDPLPGPGRERRVPRRPRDGAHLERRRPPPEEAAAHRRRRAGHPEPARRRGFRRPHRARPRQGGPRRHRRPRLGRAGPPNLRGSPDQDRPTRGVRRRCGGDGPAARRDGVFSRRRFARGRGPV